MKIFTPCWGLKHLDLLEHCLGRCLSWPKNAQSIKGAEWFFVCETDYEVEEISRIANKITNSCIQITIFRMEKLSTRDYGMAIITAFREAVARCIKQNEPMLIATVDFLFGDGTIDAFAKATVDPGSCASIAHMRVLPSAMDELFDCPTNSKLISIGLRHPHVTWSESEARMYKGGIRHFPITENIIGVQHYMPSPFFCKFINSDIDYMNEPHDGLLPGWGIIDHCLPSHLLHNGRLRYIGSSDAAVLLEVTDHDKNVSPLNGPEDPPNTYFKTKFHNQIQRQFISVFRGET